MSVEVQQPDHKPGNYYVSVIDGRRHGLALGPFPDNHAAALNAVDEVRRYIQGSYPDATWWGFGTCRIAHDAVVAVPTGKLNHKFRHLLETEVVRHG